jgi:hypothetical protein
MLKFYFGFITFTLFFSSFTFGQQRTSIHEIDYKANKDYINRSNSLFKNTDAIEPLDTTVVKELNKSV